MAEFQLEKWLPQKFWQGPPLPEFLNIYWPWYTPLEAQFIVSDLTVSPAEVNLGHPVVISCVVTNVGTKEGSYTVKMRGDFVADYQVTLEPEEAKEVSFGVVPPAVGSYQVNVNGLTGTFEVLAEGEIAVEIVRAYIRRSSPSVSEAYSGWVSFSLSSELDLSQFGSLIQVGVLLRNPTQAPLKYTPVIYNYHWIPPNDYTTDDLTLPGVEPTRFAPAPTGLPYSGYQYECDMFLPPGGTLPPGKTGFVYTELFYQSRRWNNVYTEITSNGYNLGKTLLYSGWYSY